MSLTLGSPLTLPCGVTLKNRFGKAPLTEGLADSLNRATARHAELYRRWAEELGAIGRARRRIGPQAGQRDLVLRSVDHDIAGTFQISPVDLDIAG